MPHRSSIAFVAGALTLMAARVSAQVRDTTNTSRAHADSATRLAPVEIRTSIAPTAGPSVGSGIPARIDMISSSTLDAWRTGRLTDVLAMQPDISLFDDIGAAQKMTLQSRGFDIGPTVGTPAELAVFVDGVRQNEPDAQEVNFDVLPIDHIKRVELLSGTASLLGPNAIGGAINLITDRGDGPPHGSVEVGGGSFGSTSLRLTGAGVASRGWRYYAGLSGDRADGWRAVSGSRGANGFLNLGRSLGDGGLNVQAFAGRSRVETAGSLPESIFDVSPRVNFTAGDVDDIDVGQIAVSSDAEVARGRATLRVFIRRSHADRFNANQPPDDDVRGITTNGSEGISGDWRVTATRTRLQVSLRAGFDASADQVHALLFAVPSTGVRDDSLTTDVASRRWNAAGFLIGDLRAGRATLSAGARYDEIHTPFDDRLNSSDVVAANRFHRLTPRAGVSVDLGAGARVYASAGSSFRAPALLELGCADPSAMCPLPFALGDDPPLAPVRATSFEGGAQWLVGSAVFHALVYRTDVRDEIFFVTSPNALLSGYFTNLSETRRLGAELDAEGFVGTWLGWTASYARTRATFESDAALFSVRSSDDARGSPLAGDNQVHPGDTMPLVPRDQWKGGFTLSPQSSHTVGVDVRRIGEQWLRGDEANQTRPLSTYTVVDANAGVAFGPWRVSAVVTNVLDRRAAVFGTFNEDLRTSLVERFLTPLQARSVRLIARREFGAGR